MAARSVPKLQTAIIQSGDVGLGGQNLTISHTVQIPALTSAHDVLVRVLTVALNPTDHKMPAHFPSAGNRVGCDFCGVVVQSGEEVRKDLTRARTRVCGGLFPYGRPQGDNEPDCGAFAQFVVADSRLLVRVPDTWSDLEGAVLGGIGWTTAALAMSDTDALALPGLPSAATPQPSSPIPVLVYGAATATGTMACQLLRLSGYAPIAIASNQSAKLVTAYGAHATVAYTSPTCVQDIKFVDRAADMLASRVCPPSGVPAAPYTSRKSWLLRVTVVT
jgi:NADPH:quinone reductase-like Zn-dependent oxidoreductase